jgi:tetratricopeptide (TPR) repeat protein
MPFAHPDYTIVRELGHGGSATVYLAVQNKLNRRVALKVLHGVLSADRSLGQRFLREARIVAKLNHPHIVPVHDVGEAPDQGGCFMAMEYLAGGTLKDRLPDLTLGEALQCLVQITRALGHAHRHDIVHRDVKPDNILFRDVHHALLADFGIARTTQSLTHMTMTGALLGTPDYMSPEQVGGGEVDARSDLYSLGVVLYELLTGHRPFTGDSVMSTGLAHITTPPPPLPAASKGFQACLDRALAKRPEQRYPSAEAFAAALAELERQPPVPLTTPLADLRSDQAPERRRVSTVDFDHRKGQRRRWPIPAALILVAGLTGGVWWLSGDVSPSAAPDEAGDPSMGTAGPEPAASELDRTLAAAEDAFRLDRWFGDAPDTAVKGFQQALQLAPENQAAQKRLADMLDTTVGRADEALAAGALTRAGTHLAQLETAWPDDPQVSELRQRLETARAEAETRSRQQERQRRISDLLASAGEAASAGRWTTPSSEGALGYYRQVLEVEPGNRLARAGLATVTDTILNQAEAAIADADFATATARLVEARDVLPDYPRVTRVSDALDRQRSAHAEHLRAEAAARELANAVAELTGRVNAWIVDEASALDGRYDQLQADLGALLARSPQHPELKSLEAAAARHAAALQRAEAPAPPGEDADVFRVPSF